MASSPGDTLNIPLYATAASLSLFAVHLLWASAPGVRLRATYWKWSVAEEFVPEPPHSLSEHIAQHGGATIFKFNVTRIVDCLVLLSLSIYSVASEDAERGEGGAFSAGSAGKSQPLALAITYLYTAFLSILAVAVHPKWSRLAIRHLNAVLLATFCVFVTRDIYPLATFKLRPEDEAEGSLLWIKIFFLFVGAVGIPLTIPREYIPYDPTNPNPLSEVTPEQTASLLSVATYTFLDPIIFLGYRVEHLKYEQLPPLADYDDANNLKKMAFKHMDVFVNKKGHVFFGILRTFATSWVLMSIALAIMGAASFLSPIGMNRLLNYLENPDQDPLMKPWFWILLLLLGPVLMSLGMQWFIFEGTHIGNQMSAIITQLVYEHALRIRVKADVEKAGEGKANKGDANLMGRLTNLVSSDLSAISEGRMVLLLFILVPIQITGSVVFLYKVLGWSSVVGMGVMVALLPVPGYITKLQQGTQKAVLKKKDARIQSVTEIMNLIRMIKMFGYEKQMDARIAEKREEELAQIWKRKMLELLSNLVNTLLPVLTMITTYTVYTLVAKQELSAAIVFSSISVFELLRNQLWMTFGYISTGVNAKVSLDRLNDFLHDTELLDSFVNADAEAAQVAAEPPRSDIIGFRDATFAWAAGADDEDGTVTPSSRRFLLKIEGDLVFKPGVVNLVLGPTGSGKTSLLMALLGEMHLTRPSLSTWYNLPRDKGVSYASQESWVMNDTIKNNILFNAPYDAERYHKVLYQCSLERDLELWKAGDETEVGEKGLTLSGGQKARVTLARAVYSDTQIVLLDDVLAALDVHTARHIVEKCLKGDLLKNRTVILVTHNIALTSKIAGFVVSLGLDGRIRGQGSVSEVLAHDETLQKEMEKEEKELAAVEKTEAAISAVEGGEEAVEKKEKSDKGKLIVAEEIAIGHVGWSAISLYLRGMGGSHMVLFWTSLVFVILAAEAGTTLQTWYLGLWANAYGQGEPVPAAKYIGGYGLIILVSYLLYSTNFSLFAFGAMRASRSLHKQLVVSVLGTTLRWLDRTPVSRIIARCTVDMGTIDGIFSHVLSAIFSIVVSAIIKLSAVVFFAPVFFFAGVLVGIIGGACGHVYMASQLAVKREQSNAKAPVLAHFGATMSGLVSVRAYGAEKALIKVSQAKINRFTRTTRTFFNLNRWVTVRVDSLGGLFASSLGYYVVYLTKERPFNVGFALTMALGFAELVLYIVRLANMFEVQGNSLERVQQYLTIEQEPKPTPRGVPPAYWPASGKLNVENLSAKYSEDGEEVLHGISFDIKSGERVGVVGRTGSGKSSLTLALLRLILTEGNVLYDGIPTSSLNLDALRAAITIIPQSPELLAGSLRSNLDIFNQFDDATLNAALRAAGLTALQEELEEGNETRLSLDTEIAGGGQNLSIGQRQIIALARAIVRGSKLLILDEATSAIDYKTDTVIQTSLRTELPPDTTVLTIAHRLQTIMDADKIMVLDAGRIAEFDSPTVLLEKEGGLLKALVDESGDKDALYAMARKAI
ncbi:ATP-binding cassette transporter [Mycena kentingensis (nom. inval.)]|nr:ATP-binding cassette transporter [Mycena kentingensis (nom. inval.)]